MEVFNYDVDISNGNHTYRGRVGFYDREDPYTDPYYARDRNWYYQPEYRNPYNR